MLGRAVKAAFEALRGDIHQFGIDAIRFGFAALAAGLLTGRAMAIILSVMAIVAGAVLWIGSANLDWKCIFSETNRRLNHDD